MTTVARTDRPDPSTVEWHPQMAALGLLPELADRRLPAPRTAHRAIRAALLSVTAALVLTLFASPWVHAQQTAAVGPQLTTPVSAIAPADLAAYTAVGAGAGWEEPVVLSYHDIAPDSPSVYVVTPEDFEAQMQMLSVAGYQALTLAQFQAYLAGEYRPGARSVLITFDDGTSGLWTYADRILERYDLRATSFVVTGSVGTRQPYYLTWSELRRMDATGRWEFGSHTHDLHHRTDAPVPGHPAGMLAPQHEASGELEDGDGYAARIATDLDASISVMAEHGLPAPVAFAYPFSQTGDGTETPADETVAGRLIHERFDLAFHNAPGTATSVSPEAPENGLIGRFELFADDDHRSLHEQLRAGQSARP